MPDIVQLKITLNGVEPPVWRRVQVPADYPLRRVHDVIQAVMGWLDYHLHEFRIGGKVYGQPEVDGESFGGVRIASDRNVRLGAVVERGETSFTYTYDFGDDWVHEVLMEKVMPPAEGVEYPILVDWSGACPPEDCGGPPGYEAFLKAINDPEHPDHGEATEWFGEDSFDTSHLYLDAVEAMLSRIRAARRKGPRRKAASE